MRRWIFTTWSSALAAAAIGSAASGARAATTATAAEVEADHQAEVLVEGSPEEPHVLKRVYDNASADSILNDMAAEFDLVILKESPLNMRISVRMPENADIEQAVAALKGSLIPRGFSLQPGDAVGRVWCVLPATKDDQTRLEAARRAGEAARLVPAANTMKFQFVETPVESILEEVSRKLGIEIDRSAPVPGRISVYVPNPVDAAEAMQLLNAILAPSGYTAMEIERYFPDGTPRPAVRVWPIEEAKKGIISVD